MFNGSDLGRMMAEICILHERFPKEPKNAVRRFDGVTPYGVHPTLSAMLLLHEETLPMETRETGAKALLCHDIWEDTTAELPTWARVPDVELLIKGLTFSKEEDPFTEMWKRGENIILVKLFDNAANLFCTGTMKPERRAERAEKIRKHAEYVEKQYPTLDIIKVIKGLLQ